MTGDHGDTAPRGPRARGRELALLMLCHLDAVADAELAEARRMLWANPPVGDAPGEDVFANLRSDPEALAVSDAMVDAWEIRRAEIDTVVQATSARWRIDRMDRVDRNVLRLATAELLAGADTPRAVVLSEAARLARRYGSEKSATFVNGLLDAVARRLDPGTVAQET